MTAEPVVTLRRSGKLLAALAGALAHFFLHYEGGVYKEDFVRFLRKYYAGEVRPESLEEVILRIEETGIADAKAGDRRKAPEPKLHAQVVDPLALIEEQRPELGRRGPVLGDH